MESKIKKVRSTNFSNKAELLLADQIYKEKDIIENKTSNKLSNTEKFFLSGLTLHEALALIEDDNFPHPEADIVLFPLDDGNVTDEDSGDDENISPNRLPASQLAGPAEILPPKSYYNSAEYDNEDDLPWAELRAKAIKSKVPVMFKETCGSIQETTPKNITAEIKQTPLEKNGKNTPKSTLKHFLDADWSRYVPRKLKEPISKKLKETIPTSLGATKEAYYKLKVEYLKVEYSKEGKKGQ
ncbi:hypothetical protein QE152_g29907 [Popillia japonica]|uniref:Uncharacterized protein n=1 Tax=Popillia japonica TaxID=7064 RepID=A0AAW1JFI6_POPJA